MLSFLSFLSYSIMKISQKTSRILYRVTTLALAGFILPGLFFMNSDMAVEGMVHVWLTDAVWLQQLVWYGQPLAIIAIIIGSFFPKVIRPTKRTSLRRTRIYLYRSILGASTTRWRYLYDPHANSNLCDTDGLSLYTT